MPPPVPGRIPRRRRPATCLRTRRLPRPSRSRGSVGTQKALLAGTIAMFALAAGLAGVIVLTGGSGGSEPQSPLAAPPPSTTTHHHGTVRFRGVRLPPRRRRRPHVDQRGAHRRIVGHGCAGLRRSFGALRCGSTPAAAIRTANSLAIVCEAAPGSYYYRGERLSDGAQLQLAMPCRPVAVRRCQPGRRLPIPGAAGPADDLE